eukprot:gene10058-11087_t
MATDTRKLPKIQREIDELKRKIDDLRGRDLPDLGVTSPERRVAYKKSTDLKADVFDLIYQVGQLSLKDERLPTAEFEAKKSQECRRLAAMKEQLEKISHQLEPDEMEEEYLRWVKYLPGGPRDLVLRPHPSLNVKLHYDVQQSSLSTTEMNN